MLDCIVIGLGGFTGSVLRYLAGKIPHGNPAGFPINTLLINVLGSFVIGLAAAFAGGGGLPVPHHRPRREKGRYAAPHRRADPRIRYAKARYVTAFSRQNRGRERINKVRTDMAACPDFSRGRFSRRTYASVPYAWAG